MTQKELSEILDVKPHQIQVKCASSNRLSQITMRALLAMPKSVIEPYLIDEIKAYEERANK